MSPIKKLLLILLLVPVFAEGQVITTIVGNGTMGYSGDGNPATSAACSMPQSARLDKQGNLYIADKLNNVIRKVNTSGLITTIVGTGVAGYSGDGGIATNAQLNKPTDVVIDSLGNIYIPDGLNYVVRKVNTTGIISTIAGTGTSGYSGDGGVAISAQCRPYSLAIDNFGNIYISEPSNQRIRKISNTGIISTIAGTGIGGFTGDGGPATSAQLHNPSYIAISPAGEIYIPDWSNHRVRKIDLSGIISTVAGNGAAGYSGDGSAAVAASLNAPCGIAFDNFGNYYISDVANHLIRKVNSSGVISTVAGNNTYGFSGDNGPATNAQLSNAICAGISPVGNLYITDQENNRIRKVFFQPEAITDLMSNAKCAVISPNPVTTRLAVTSTKVISELVIINSAGQPLYCRQYNAEQVQVDIADLPAGNYFIKINGAEVRQFIKL